MARPGAGGINTENWVRGAENSGERPKEAAPRTAPAAPRPAQPALPSRPEVPAQRFDNSPLHHGRIPPAIIPDHSLTVFRDLASFRR